MKIYKAIKLLIHEDVQITIEDIEKELNTPRNNVPLPYKKNKIGICEDTFTTSSKNKLDDRNVRIMVAKYSQKAGITKNVSPHIFASDLLRATKNIRLVQKALGHEDLSTTMIYTHIVDDEFEDALKNLRG